MRDIPGLSCLVTDVDDLFVAAPLSRTTGRARTYATHADPGDDQLRAAASATAGRPAYICCDCGRSTTDDFMRRSKSGKVFCLVCAKRAVAAYYARHPEARPVPPRVAAERTGVSYLAVRERYAVRYHAGNGRWQISDTQTHRWSSFTSQSEADVTAKAEAMNATWRAQLANERASLGRRTLPSTSPWHTGRVGEARYGIDPA